MTRLLRIAFSCGLATSLLTACSDPLSDVDRLSSVQLAEESPRVEIAERPDVARSGGFFSRMRSQTPPVPETLPAEGKPQQEQMQEQLTDALAEQAQSKAASAQPARRGLLGLFARSSAPQTKQLAQPQPASVSAPMQPAPPAKVAPVAAQAAPEPKPQATAAIATPPEQAAPKPPRRGLFSRLTKARQQAPNTEVAAKQPPAPAKAVRTASLNPALPAPAPALAKPTPAKKPGLFAGRKTKHKGPDVEIVPQGTRLPQGRIARVCDLPTRHLGKEAGKFPERGRGYTIYDSAPGSAAPRPFYVTGFSDRCARTFTAALALFGSPSMHEQLRYGLPSKTQPYSNTDKAYEGVKSKICKVGRKKPCGAAKINKLEKSTVFVSIYDRIGTNGQWSNILLHDGWVLAMDRKD